MSKSSSSEPMREKRRERYARRNEPRTDTPKTARRDRDAAERPTDRSGAGRPAVWPSNGEPSRSGLKRTLEILKVIAGIVLLFAISWEIIAGDHIDFSPAYMITQFVVCLVFLCDFFVRWGVARRRSRFFWVHLPYLLISIPYLNILDWSGVVLTRDWALLVGLIPMLRAFLAMVIVVQWLVSKRNRMGRVFWAYIFTVVVFTYLSALVFFDYEAGVNTKLAGFGNALWWAWMNVTTVGAQIFAVTAVGKIVTVLLPSLGMMFFPIFTTYILDRYTGKKEQL